jgi:large subunit ribosomal protein L5e
MPFVKVQKNKAYYKRYQTKFRRRREGKTDYRARKRLVAQDKNKYQSPRYRLVVRLTRHYVITQIVKAEIEGDKIFASAYSSELPRYGLKVGLKNYAAAYATGLLVARRALHKLGLGDQYKGNVQITGEIVSTEHTNDAGKKREYYVSEVADRKPFRAVLDIGIRATTTGARIFGVLKGAADGGLDIPHNEKRFPGYDRDSKKYDAEAHKERIFGQHVSSYMSELKEEDEEAYRKQFSQFVKHGVKPDAMEKLYKDVHAAIRKDPAPAPKKKFTPDLKFKKPAKQTLEQRKANVAAKKAKHAASRLAELRAQAADADDEEDDE